MICAALKFIFGAMSFNETSPTRLRPVCTYKHGDWFSREQLSSVGPGAKTRVAVGHTE